MRRVSARAGPEQKIVEVGSRVKLACPRGKGSRDNLRQADFKWWHKGRLIMFKPIGQDEPIFAGTQHGMLLKQNKSVVSQENSR